mmetsp:Transcript_46223/g.100645  ORF Transcript_46223/g.100645 Transcript_46223/m.100645 type:complete len:266 (-) Transcript_46223:382-1179(-)
MGEAPQGDSPEHSARGALRPAALRGQRKVLTLFQDLRDHPRHQDQECRRLGIAEHGGDRQSLRRMLLVRGLDLLFGADILLEGLDAECEACLGRGRQHLPGVHGDCLQCRSLLLSGVPDLPSDGASREPSSGSAQDEDRFDPHQQDRGVLCEGHGLAGQAQAGSSEHEHAPFGERLVHLRSTKHSLLREYSAGLPHGQNPVSPRRRCGLDKLHRLSDLPNVLCDATEGGSLLHRLLEGRRGARRVLPRGPGTLDSLPGRLWLRCH